MSIRLVIALAFTLVGGPFALAAQSSGTAVSVDPSASATGQAGARILAVNSDVFTGDLVKTDASGRAQILFRDNTRLVVGQNSEVTLDSFVFQDASTARTFSLDAVRGSFRFITGLSAKDAYTITTPTASLGVRGTEFDLTIAEDGTTNVALFGGSVRVCDKATPDRHCLVLTDACSVLILSPDGQFRDVRSYYDRTALMNTVFPFAFRQQPLLADFRVESRGCNIPNLDPAPSPSSHDRPPPRPPQVE
jgi:ferric-dicitrate binding protein FerR (iron transport regulator)